MSAYSIIDVDTHITEVPDLWTSRVPASMREQVPRVERDAQGRDWWWLGTQRVAAVGMTATAGSGDFKSPPRGYDDMHRGAFDPVARLAYMDSLGIWAMVLYPNVGGFGAQEFLKLRDPELMLTCVQAYNDWQTEWASADPRRLLPITSIPFWDVAASVREIRRCAKDGHRGILFTGDPQSFGMPVLGDHHWDPLWEVAVELKLPVSFHIGSGNMESGLLREKVKAYGRMAAFAEFSVDLFLNNGRQLCDLLMSGVLARHPDIRFVSVESGIGWIPFVLEALDYQFTGNRVREDRPEFDALPSVYFRRNVFACYWFEQTAPRRLLDAVGVENILFETDFPHPTSLYGEEVRARIDAGLGECDASTRRRILWDNAASLYKVSAPPLSVVPA